MKEEKFSILAFVTLKHPGEREERGGVDGGREERGWGGREDGGSDDV